MLELFKSNGGKTQATQQEQIGALHLLVTRANEEREALQSALNVLAQGDATAQSLATQVTEATDMAAGLSARLDELTARLADVETRGSLLDGLDARIQALAAAAAQAERKVQDAVGPSSDLRKHQLLLEQVAAQGTRLQEFTERTEQSLRGLETLSDQVSQKTKTLEHQQQIVEHAVVQSNRVSEMVWTMETRLKTVTSAIERAASAEQTIERSERLASEATARLAATTATRQEIERDLDGLKSVAMRLMETEAQKTAALDGLRAEFE